MLETQEALRLIDKVAEHNNYGDARMVEECDKLGKWTPVDLICREYLNNGGGSAKGFLGITTKQCCDLYEFIVTHKENFINCYLISKDAWNNFGCPLWKDYQLPNC